MQNQEVEENWANVENNLQAAIWLMIRNNITSNYKQMLKICSSLAWDLLIHKVICSLFICVWYTQLSIFYI